MSDDCGWLDDIGAQLAKGGRGGDHMRAVVERLPPIPKIPLLRVPPMPAAGGDRPLELLRSAYMLGAQCRRVRIARTPRVDQLPDYVIESLTRCDAELAKHAIPPHAWAVFVIEGLVTYQAAVTLRSVWYPDKVAKRRGHFKRWLPNRYPPTRRSAAHVHEDVAWQAMIEDAAANLTRDGALDQDVLLARHYPAPLGYAGRIADAIRSTEIEQAQLERAASNGEWVW